MGYTAYQREDEMPASKMPKRASTSGIRSECFIICDVVRLENGKMYILGGGWDLLTPTQLPLAYRFNLAIKLAIPRAEVGDPVNIELTVVDELDREIGTSPAGLRMELEEPSDNVGDEIPLMIPLGMEVTIVLPGTYRLRLTVNDKAIAQTRFRVIPPLAVDQESMTDDVQPSTDRAME